LALYDFHKKKYIKKFGQFTPIFGKKFNFLDEKGQHFPKVSYDKSGPARVFG